MSRRQEGSFDNAPGQDSFLDIVANLVGILVILVMVVGVRAQDALLKGIDPPENKLGQLEEQVENEQHTAQAIETDINQDMAAKLMRQQLEVASRQAERDQMLVVITAAKRLLEQRREELDTAGQKVFDTNRKLEEARTELRLLENSRRVAENASAPPVVIEHRPTPLAKTVRTKEIFFRLMNGRLAYVPKEELEELMLEDMRSKAAKLRTQPEVVETVGPIRRFRLRYTLVMRSYVQDNGFGPSQRVGPAFDHYTLLPESDQLGEPLDVALRPDSLFRRELARAAPGTTVTVWVYPEDFGHFRRLKDEVYKLGFLTASWPMPAGQPIEASPEGSRSVVQ